jgi:hypothetical protein
MRALPRKDERTTSRKGGCHNWRNSRIQVMRKTQMGITFAERFEGKKRKAIRIQKISYSTPAP